MELGWQEMIFAVGTANGMQTLVEISLGLFALMIISFVMSLIMGKI